MNDGYSGVLDAALVTRLTADSALSCSVSEAPKDAGSLGPTFIIPPIVLRQPFTARPMTESERRRRESRQIAESVVPPVVFDPGASVGDYDVTGAGILADAALTHMTDNFESFLLTGRLKDPDPTDVMPVEHTIHRIREKRREARVERVARGGSPLLLNECRQRREAGDIKGAWERLEQARIFNQKQRGRLP